MIDNQQVTSGLDPVYNLNLVVRYAFSDRNHIYPGIAGLQIRNYHVQVQTILMFLQRRWSSIKNSSVSF